MTARPDLARLSLNQITIDQASLPVFGTVASRFNDDGVTGLYQHVREVLGRHGLVHGGWVGGRHQRADGREHRPEVEAAAAVDPVDPGPLLDRAVRQHVAGGKEGEAGG